MDRYRMLLANAGQKTLMLDNRDFDTGEPTRAGEYRLADSTYAKLVVKLADRDPATLDPKLRANILGFFGDLSEPLAIKADAKKWQQTTAALEKLRTVAADREAPAEPTTSLSTK
jgi:hypothetical protein